MSPQGEWRLGEDNVGGGYNIYCGEKRVAHTSAVRSPGMKAVSEEEARENAALIVEAVNLLLVQRIETE